MTPTELEYRIDILQRRLDAREERVFELRQLLENAEHAYATTEQQLNALVDEWALLVSTHQETRSQSPLPLGIDTE